LSFALREHAPVQDIFDVTDQGESAANSMPFDQMATLWSSRTQCAGRPRQNPNFPNPLNRFRLFKPFPQK
jgi:hypothetical protein